MNSTLIILIVIAIAAAAVVWFIRRKPDVATTAPKEGDTAWNDPIEGEPPVETSPTDAVTDTPRPRDPQP